VIALYVGKLSKFDIPLILVLLNSNPQQLLATLPSNTTVLTVKEGHVINKLHVSSQENFIKN
jgi:hypothetical protein